MAHLDESRKKEMQGVRTELIKRGKFKAMQGATLTDEQRQHLQDRIDTVYDWFRAAVRSRRAIPQAAMEGQAFYAEEAKKQHLIDKVGSRADAIHELKTMIGGK
jgi:ClpP class serine protease